MMIAVPLEMLGIEGYKEINVEFKIADSDTVYDEMEDFYCDGDAAPLGRLNYIFQNYIPGVSQITYPEGETQPETKTEIHTSANTVDETETDAPKGGCSSVVRSAAILITAVPGACVLLRKRED